MDDKSMEAGLRKRLREISIWINALERDLRKEHSYDFAEQVTERESDEVLEGLLAEVRNEKLDTSAALAGIKDGTYGKCSECDKAIDNRRPAARPEARTCIDCAI